MKILFRSPLQIKAMADEVENYVDFERTVLIKSVIDQIRRLHDVG